MSRIGKLPIPLTKEVKINISDDNTVTVKGPKGELTQQVDSCIKLNVSETVLQLERENDEKRSRSMHGLYRALLNNMVKGVTEGFTITQEVVGVGYKASVTGQLLELTLGHSHVIILELPKEIKVQAITERGKNPTIIMTSADKQLIGQVAAKIRSLRKPEPYKGKGIKFKDEVLRKKAGKTAAASK